tara:strand:+ start:274 stop:498 length:225 start_codon:yes stop_codon:yes gene_type:complete
LLAWAPYVAAVNSSAFFESAHFDYASDLMVFMFFSLPLSIVLYVWALRREGGLDVYRKVEKDEYKVDIEARFAM